VIDITLPGWKKSLEEMDGIKNLESGIYSCFGPAYVAARKRIPSSSLVQITSLEEVPTGKEEEEGPAPAVVRVGEMVISKKFHPSILNSGVWLSPHHLDIINELFHEGFVIEILDEENNLIETLEDKKNG